MKVALTAALIAVACAASACSALTSPTTATPPPTRVPVSDESIQRVVGNFARGAGNAANDLRVSGVQPPSATTLLIRKMVTVLVNQPISQRINCESGGYHEIVGRISGTVADTGISRLQMNMTQSINNYSCMGGGWIINGDPYISNTGEVRVTGNHASVDFGQALGWRATNAVTGLSFSCTHNIRITWDSLNAGRISGRVECTPPSTTVSISGTF